jgi:hypothetical protein
MRRRGLHSPSRELSSSAMAFSSGAQAPCCNALFDGGLGGVVPEFSWARSAGPAQARSTFCCCSGRAFQ